MKKGNLRERLRTRFGLSLLFSFAVFIVLVVTAFFAAFIFYLAFRFGAVNQIAHRGPLLPVLFLLMISIIVGTIVSFVGSKFALKPIRRIIDATNQLAAGDFTARLDIRRPPEVAELTESFNRMAQELGNVELLRSDFIDNFSHEFKTPIVSIKGFAEMLKYSDLSDEERNEYLDIVISESSRLASLAKNVLDLSKVEKQEILTERTRFNVGEQIRRSIILMEKEWEGKGLTLTAEIQDLDIVGNEEMLSQVWMNLLDNAIKFSPNGEEIAISLGSIEEQLCFTVFNKGAEIPADAQRRIYDKFYQGDTSHSSPGNGLGLALAKRIIELHHGSITCTSDSVGTEFTVMLPTYIQKHTR